MTVNLICTCSAAPEQYDAVDGDGNKIAYLRLRHGQFTVECPDAFGTVVYSAALNGRDIFDTAERERYLTAAVKAIAKYYNHRQSKKE